MVYVVAVGIILFRGCWSLPRRPSVRERFVRLMAEGRRAAKERSTFEKGSMSSLIERVNNLNNDKREINWP